MSSAPLVIGVAGGSGSGKTTVVRRLVESVGDDHVTVLDHDRYYRDRLDLRLEDRAALNWGILVFTDPALRAQMDVKVFVDTDADTRFIRRLQRDVAERGRTMQSVIEQYLSTVKPMHLDFVEPSKRYADVILPQGGHNAVAIDMLLTLVRSLVQR
jgi:uridine kinase